MTKEIVLLHGWGGSKESLKPLANELESLGYKTWRLEMPGHGDTPIMTKPWEMHDFALWVAEEIKALKLKNFILVGHSFGGKIILEGLASQILSPEQAFLIDISGIKPKNKLKTKIFLNISKIVKPILSLPILKKLKYYGYRYVVGEMDYYKTSGNLKETFKIINSEHYDNKLTNIKIPVIIVWGEQDKATPVWMAHKLHRQIASSKLFIEQGTHGLPLTAPRVVANIIHQNI